MSLAKWIGAISGVPPEATINDIVGGYNLTASGTVVAPHPEVIYPTGPQIGNLSVVDVTVYPGTFELALTQETPTILFPLQTILPSTFQLALTQQTPVIIAGVIITPNTLELALTLETPTVHIDCTVTPPTLELALSLPAPTIVGDVTVIPATLALALTLHAPTIITAVDVTVYPGTFELALTQPSPTVSIRFVDIPPFMEKDLIDPYSDMGAWLWLAEIVIPTQTTQRIARNTADVVYGGTPFVKSNFDIGPISLAGDASIPRIQLRVAQGLDHTLEDIVNATKGGKNGTIKLIRTCEKYFDSPVNALEHMYDVITAGSDPMWVTFTLGIPNPLTQRIPLWSYSSKVCPLATPSLFKGPRCQLPLEHEDDVCTGLFEDCRTKGNAAHWGAEIGLDPNAVRV